MAVKSYTCGVPFPSGCILYTGEIPEFIDIETFPCDPRLDDIIEAIGDKVNEILDGLDLTHVDPSGFEFDPETAQIKDVLQEVLTKVYDHDLRLIAVEEDLAGLDISNRLINIDMGCLAPSAAACAQGTNTYDLLAILLTFKNEICAIKTYLNI